MTNEIVKINASDYGLEETKANEIKSMFVPMLTKMDELEVQYNDILKREIDPETCQMAKDLRLAYVRTRTGTEKIHKDLKAFYLNGGRFVDAFKNTQAFASGEKEKTLKAIEDHFENQERERLEKLRTERLELLQPYTEIEPLALGHMEQTVFDNYLTGVKLAHEQRIAAEKKAEEDRLAAIEAERVKQEKIRLDNVRLQKEAKERERLMAAEREKARVEQERIEKERAAEREKAERTNRELEEKARKEREAREKIEAESKAREAARLKAIEDEKRARAEAEKKMRLAPDKDKLLAFMQAINDLPRPEVKTIEAAPIAANANTMLIQAANYIRDNANKL